MKKKKPHISRTKDAAGMWSWTVSYTRWPWVMPMPGKGFSLEYLFANEKAMKFARNLNYGRRGDGRLKIRIPTRPPP